MIGRDWENQMKVSFVEYRAPSLNPFASRERLRFSVARLHGRVSRRALFVRSCGLARMVVTSRVCSRTAAAGALSAMMLVRDTAELKTVCQLSVSSIPRLRLLRPIQSLLPLSGPVPLPVSPKDSLPLPPYFLEWNPYQ